MTYSRRFQPHTKKDQHLRFSLSDHPTLSCPRIKQHRVKLRNFTALRNASQSTTERYPSRHYTVRIGPRLRNTKKFCINVVTARHRTITLNVPQHPSADRVVDRSPKKHRTEWCFVEPPAMPKTRRFLVKSKNPDTLSRRGKRKPYNRALHATLETHTLADDELQVCAFHDE